jgi:hypothetical protein
MNPSTQRNFDYLRRLVGMVGVVLIAFAPTAGPAAGLSGSFKARNVEIPVFSGNASEPTAMWRIENVFTEHRRIGFFQVKLMPVLVAERVRLALIQTNAPINWLEVFSSRLMSAANKNALEWRDFSLVFPAEDVPRLRADRAHPSANAGTATCRLEGVTLQVGSRQLNVPHAELRAAAGSGQVVWRAAAMSIQWDLFTGQCTTNKVETTIAK